MMQKLILILVILMLSLVACGRREREQAEEAAKTQPEATEAQPQALPTAAEEPAEPEAKIEPTPTQAQPAVALGDTSPPAKPLLEIGVSPVSTPPSARDLATPLPGTERLMEKAKQLLVELAGGQLALNEIEVAAMEPVEWSDSSLGCPQEGMMYAQMITPGYRLILEAGGQTYEFHTNTTDQVIPCFEGG